MTYSDAQVPAAVAARDKYRGGDNVRLARPWPS